MKKVGLTLLFVVTVLVISLSSYAQPVIDQLNPDEVPSLSISKVRIIGTGFGVSQGGSQIHIEGQVVDPGDILVWSDNRVKCWLPEALWNPPADKWKQVWVTVGSDSNKKWLHITAPPGPVISFLNPDVVAGRTTDKVRIIGENFGSGGQIHVIGTILTYPGDLDILYWSNTKIKLFLPHNYLPPVPKFTDLWVTVNGKDSNKEQLKVAGVNPIIEDLNPDTVLGEASSIVRILGVNFGNTKENGQVHVGGDVLDPDNIIAWSDMKIKFYLPRDYDDPWPKIAPVWVTINRVNSNSKWLDLTDPTP